MFFIQALIDQSVVCKQKVKHVCFSNALTNLSSWTGRNGVTNFYWSGNRNSTDKGGISKISTKNIGKIFNKNNNVIVKNNTIKVVNAVLMITAAKHHIYTRNQSATVTQCFLKVKIKEL